MHNAIIRRMLDVIEHEYASAVTLRTLSMAVGRQPAYVGRLFRQEVGSTAHDYLTQVRLEHAAALIRDGVKSRPSPWVSGIAARRTCVWQLLIARQSRPGHRLNATIRTRSGELIGVHLITVRNFLWGRREMSTLFASMAG